MAPTEIRTPAALRIRLKYADVDTFIRRYAGNFSRGGVFIATRTPKQVGALVRFEFLLSTGVPVFRGEGDVVWVRQFDPEEPGKPHGMSVRFVRLDSESRSLLERALSWKQAEEDPWPATQSQVIRAARQIAQMTVSQHYYPEDAILEELLRPVHIPVPASGREASQQLEALLLGQSLSA